MHALVVGGSGMLRGLCLRLADDGMTVSVLARNRGRLEAMAMESQDAPGRVIPLAADYRDSAGLRAAIREAEDSSGSIDLAICWIHSSAPHALAVIAERVRGELIHLVSSASTHPLLLVRRDLPLGGKVRQRTVVLGFQRHAGRSRWLTDHEIVSGVLHALRSEETVTIVGTMDPWELRPR